VESTLFAVPHEIADKPEPDPHTGRGDVDMATSAEAE
jgi:hypothetical protein